MNSVWILILFTQFTTAEAPKLTMQEFSSRQTCMAAGSKTKQMTRGVVKENKFSCEKK